MVEPYAPVACPKCTAIFEIICTNCCSPGINALAAVLPSNNVKPVSRGLILSGMLAVKAVDCVPVLVLPEYVSTKIVPVPLVAFGISFAKSSGIVQVVDVSTLLAIVPDLLPQAYLTVCLKLEL